MRFRLVVFALLALLQERSQELLSQPGDHDVAAAATPGARIAKLPLRFEANAGQWDAKVRFVAHGNGTTLFLTDEGATLAVRDVKMPPRQPGARREDDRVAREKALAEATRVAITLKVVGATSSAPQGEEQIVTKSNFFLGNDPARWRTNVPNFAQVRAEDALPGVDVVWHGGPDGLEYDLVVAAGVDASTVALDVGGAESVRVGDDGALEIATVAGTLVQKPPRVVQDDRELRTRYRAEGASRVGFDIEGYDRTRAILIDPVLAYSTYLGGRGDDVGTGIAIDGSGNVYATGYTPSTDFPTKSPLQASNASDYCCWDAYVTKLDPSGTALVYSTYLGGKSDDLAFHIAVDGSGDAYVTGDTDSTDFPTKGPLQGSNAGAIDAFVTKLNAAGSALVYSTYLGGTNGDFGFSVAIDGAGNAYITGDTGSTDFPTKSALQGVYGGGSIDGFVSKLNAAGTALVYSTYVGGTNEDLGQAIAVDGSGNAYVTGDTFSIDFPTKNALQGSNAGDYDGFVSKLDASGTGFVYSTYLGGTKADYSSGITVDGAGNTYVTGETGSTDFPTQSALQSSNAGSADAFVSKLNAAGSALTYSTYLGGTGRDQGLGIAVDGAGNAYVTGETSSVDFSTQSALQPSNAGDTDLFISKLNTAGSALVYSTYLGGALIDTQANGGIAVDGSGAAYLTGYTTSTDFPVQNALQASSAGGQDAVIVKIAKVGLPLALAPPSATVPPLGKVAFTASGGSGIGYTYSLQTNASGGSINAKTGAYVAGTTPNVIDVVKVVDANSDVATSTVNVGPSTGDGGAGDASTGDSGAGDASTGDGGAGDGGVAPDWGVAGCYCCTVIGEPMSGRGRLAMVGAAALLALRRRRRR